MAVVKANFVKRGRGEKARAKQTVRYMLHRTRKDGERITRKLFGVDGILGKEQAYRMIDEAKLGTIFFRIILSPDPRREDAGRDLDLWAITTQTMQRLEERLKKELQWIAVEHDDHSPNRHIHTLVLIQGRLTRADFLALRQAVTQLALTQRQERDLAQGYRKTAEKPIRASACPSRSARPEVEVAGQTTRHRPDLFFLWRGTAGLPNRRSSLQLMRRHPAAVREQPKI